MESSTFFVTTFREVTVRVKLKNPRWDKMIRSSVLNVRGTNPSSLDEFKLRLLAKFNEDATVVLAYEATPINHLVIT